MELLVHLTKETEDWTRCKMSRKNVISSITNAKEKYFIEVLDKNRSNTVQIWKNLPL